MRIQAEAVWRAATTATSLPRTTPDLNLWSLLPFQLQRSKLFPSQIAV
jgi:hypothetical protein